jgi:hypothetical protein
MGDPIKEGKLALGVLSLVAATTLGVLVFTGGINLGDYNPFPQKREITDIQRLEQMRLDFTEGRIDAALATANYLMRTMLDNPEPPKLAIACYLRLHQPGKAREVARSWVLRSPDDFTFQLAEAQASMEMGLIDEARKTLERIRANPKAAPLEKDAALAMMVQTDLVGVAKAGAPPPADPMPDRPEGRPPWLDMKPDPKDKIRTGRARFKSGGEPGQPRGTDD